ncbi:MAG: hypothetical protein IT384_03400 [Deltaproteobacteria bacterium]|nr:hypothetical protein [Deltaproteobacteria bacterium]
MGVLAGLLACSERGTTALPSTPGADDAGTVREDAGGDEVSMDASAEPEDRRPFDVDSVVKALALADCARQGAVRHPLGEVDHDHDHDHDYDDVIVDVDVDVDVDECVSTGSCGGMILEALALERSSVPSHAQSDANTCETRR